MQIESQEPDINDIYQNAQPYDIIEDPERFAEIKDDIADFREEEMVNYEPGEMELDEEERCSTYEINGVIDILLTILYNKKGENKEDK